MLVMARHLYLIQSWRCSEFAIATVQIDVDVPLRRSDLIVVP